MGILNMRRADNNLIMCRGIYHSFFFFAKLTTDNGKWGTRTEECFFGEAMGGPNKTVEPMFLKNVFIASNTILAANAESKTLNGRLNPNMLVTANISIEERHHHPIVVFYRWRHLVKYFFQT